MFLKHFKIVQVFCLKTKPNHIFLSSLLSLVKRFLIVKVNDTENCTTYDHLKRIKYLQKYLVLAVGYACRLEHAQQMCFIIFTKIFFFSFLLFVSFFLRLQIELLALFTAACFSVLYLHLPLKCSLSSFSFFCLSSFFSIPFSWCSTWAMKHQEI